MAGSGYKAAVSMVGTHGLFIRENLERFLEAFETSGRFAPQSWGLEERASSSYSRADILARVAPAGKPISQLHLYLRRKSAPAYHAMISTDRRPWFSIEVSPKLAASDYPGLFELADKLAHVFRPDFGAAHVAVGLRDEDDMDEPWANDDERDAELMYYASLIAPVDYYSQGPTGLAMRSYIGPHFASQFGTQRLDSLPLVVEKQAWGGYRIDLVPEPWNADLPTLLDAWRKGMAHLEPAQVFAVPQIDDGELDGYAKGARADIGGVANADD